MMSRGSINILYCENNVDGTVGGSYYSLLYLASGLDRERYRPLVVFYTPHALLSAFAEAGVETQIFSRPTSFMVGTNTGVRALRAVLAPVRRALNFGQFLWTGLSRAWFLRRKRIAIVHLNNSILYNHDWMLGAHLAGCICVTHERGINNRYPRTARFFGRRLDAVICISAAVANQMRDHGADFGNVTVIHNGLDPETMRVRTGASEIKQAFGLAPTDFIIGMAGNLKAWKGQDTLVRAVDELRKQYPAVRCLLIGDTSPGDRPFEAAVRQEVVARGLERHIVFTGYQRNIADLLNVCEIVVHASVLPEPFGRVLLEAMACRKPIVAARAGGVTEIVVEGETGYLFVPGDSAELARALLRLAADPEERRRLGTNGYKRLTADFHIRKNTELTEGLYDRLLRERHQSS